MTSLGELYQQYLKNYQVLSNNFLKCFLPGGWTNPFEKYARQNGGILPQFSGWTYIIFETITPIFLMVLLWFKCQLLLFGEAQTGHLSIDKETMYLAGCNAAMSRHIDFLVLKSIDLDLLEVVVGTKKNMFPRNGEFFKVIYIKKQSIKHLKKKHIYPLIRSLGYESVERDGDPGDQ